MDSPPDHKWLLDVLAPKTKGGWNVKIHNGMLSMNYLLKDRMWDRQSCDFKHSKRTNHEQDTNHMEFVKAVNERPEELFSRAVQVCAENTCVIISLAYNLSHKSIERFCSKLFKSNLDENFVRCFYDVFFSSYLQRDYSWFTLDLLIRARTAWPGPFMALLKSLFKNVKVPNRVLKDYVVNVKDDHRNEIMNALMGLRLVDDEFIHHLPTINFIFLKSEKTAATIQTTYAWIEKYHWHCYTNRDFGRLLLNFVNNLGDVEVTRDVLESIIRMHGSEMKGACLVAFRESEAARRRQPQVRWFHVDRPVDVQVRVA